MVFKAAIFTLLVSYVACQGDQRCTCVEEGDGSVITVTQTPGGGNEGGVTTVTTIVIPVLGGAVSQIRYDILQLPDEFKQDFQQVSSAGVATFLLGEDELQKENAPPRVVEEVQRVRGTLTERLNSGGGDLRDPAQLRTYLIRLTSAYNQAASQLSQLAGSADGAAYRDTLYNIIIRLNGDNSYYTLLTDLSECNVG